ncbi:IclR family transcriptional regulator [Bradyrhizobium sp. RD5-C2]|uniref:IclR family transcriptional regulator n=1 Tax=Bradyrhizobium sp. RD5-C2 TaxID=244562 RepID=UPI001CC7E726|nr:IclR family transcriptional regulator [Bradyrhizobium sp. RD5-C2]GIQ76936.1 transcriptional regulator [Bradyrhizobium sp. RD5-C2]
MARLTAFQRKADTDGLDQTGDDARVVQGLSRGLTVLRAFRPGETSLSNSELAARTGLAKATISRLTQTLTALGYLSYSPRLGRYQLGAGVVALCHSLLAGMPHRIAARPLLQDIADFARVPASLGMRDQSEMVTIETARHPHMRPMRFDLGSKLPIETTAMGRAYLFGLPAEEREMLLKRLRLQHSREEWRDIRARLDKAFEQLTERGFCVSLGDRRPDVFAVGAPLVTPEGIVLAINCGGMPSEVSAERLEHEIGPRIAQAAAQISAEPAPHA